MDILFKIFFYLLILYGILSIPICLYTIYTGYDLSRNPLFGIKIFSNEFFFYGCFITLGLILGFLFSLLYEQVFFFLPENILYTGIMGFFISGLGIIKFEKYSQNKRNNKAV